LPPKEPLYVHTDFHHSALLEALTTVAGLGLAVGLDTEFYNVSLGEQSCAGRAKLHVWSLAVPIPGEVTPRGNLVAIPYVLPGSSALRPRLREWLEGPALKAVHNLPVDAHTLWNTGVKLGGGVNTLSLARWAWPDRARGPGFTLDALGRDFLGVGKMTSYDELTQEKGTEYRIRTKRVVYCECGATPCKRRATTPGHRRLERLEETRIPKEVTREIPLESIGPDHPRWPILTSYAAQDAVLALGVYELAHQRMALDRREVPWL
jgi:hypothetical protein